MSEKDCKKGAWALIDHDLRHHLITRLNCNDVTPVTFHVQTHSLFEKLF